MLKSVGMFKTEALKKVKILLGTEKESFKHRHNAKLQNQNIFFPQKGPMQMIMYCKMLQLM